MSWFASKSPQTTLDSIFDRFIAILDKGTPRSATIYDIGDLPADKELMKAILLSKAYMLGPAADEILKAGFVFLASFQSDCRETPEKHMQIAGEMMLLQIEWHRRVVYQSETEDA
jgi:hypothetical protein